MSSLGIVTATLAADVANNATVDIAYPTGQTKSTLFGSSGGDLTVDEGGYGAWEEGASGFLVTYNSATITITNKSGLTWPSGKTIRVSFGTTPNAGSYNLTLGVDNQQAARQTLRVQELLASGAITPNIDVVELNHISVIIAATYTVILNTVLTVKDTSASGTAAHTVTLTGGTWNGTNTIATLNARDKLVQVQFDSTGRGTIIANVGTATFS